MPVWLLNWKWLTSAAVAGIAATFITATVYRITIAHMERDQANAALTAANVALKQFTDDTATIHDAAAAFDSVQFSLSHALGTISKDFNIAIKARPLPADCKPDALRLDALKRAVTAANQAAVPK